MNLCWHFAIRFASLKGLAVPSRSYPAEERQQGSVKVETFEKPDPSVCFGLRRGDYSKLGSDGLVEPGSRVLGDDIIVGKVGSQTHQVDSLIVMSCGHNTRIMFPLCSVPHTTPSLGVMPNLLNDFFLSGDASPRR